MTDFQRRSLELTPEQWQALEKIAEETGSVAPTGPNAGEASWRTLIKRIADKDMKMDTFEVGDRVRYTIWHYTGDVKNLEEEEIEGTVKSIYAESPFSDLCEVSFDTGLFKTVRANDLRRSN